MVGWLWVVAGLASVGVGLLPVDAHPIAHSLVALPVFVAQPLALLLHARLLDARAGSGAPGSRLAAVALVGVARVRGAARRRPLVGAGRARRHLAGQALAAPGRCWLLRRAALGCLARRHLVLDPAAQHQRAHPQHEEDDPHADIAGTTTALAKVSTWISQPSVTPHGRRISPAARKHSTASPTPIHSQAWLRSSPSALARPRATSAPRNTTTPWLPSTVASIRQVNLPSEP